MGITYFVDYKCKEIHLWKLREGCTLDCNCATRGSMCNNRLCGFTNRFEPHCLSFVSKHREKTFWFLNQLQPASYLVSSPQQDVVSTKDGSLQCSCSNLDFFFRSHDMVPAILGVHQTKRNGNTLLWSRLKSFKSLKQRLQVSSSSRYSVDRMKFSFDHLSLIHI